MSQKQKTRTILGNYLKSKRELVGLSQKILGSKMNPPVTTQFISNIERGITPLPMAHFKAMADALSIPPRELVDVMEAEYSSKLQELVIDKDPKISVRVSEQEKPFLESFIQSYLKANSEKKEIIRKTLESLLELPSHHPKV